MTLPIYIQGKYAEAEPLYARATEIWDKALGPDHPLVATALNNRAELLSICSPAVLTLDAICLLLVRCVPGKV